MIGHETILFRHWTASLRSHVRYAHADRVFSCPRNTTSERSHLTMAMREQIRLCQKMKKMNSWKKEQMPEQSNALPSI